jgi:predicted hydrocarbon binding protein
VTENCKSGEIVESEIGKMLRSMMNIPIDKNRSWMSGVYEGIDRFDEHTKAAVMRPAGKACASDIIALCEKYLGRTISTIDELLSGWNTLRERRKLTGRWVSEGNTIRGVFGECGCPLVRSGLIELHPVHCYCSQSMMETIFSQFSKKPVDVRIKRAIGRGDEVCEFVIRML